jgi:hypothetical protein
MIVPNTAAGKIAGNSVLVMPASRDLPGEYGVTVINNRTIKSARIVIMDGFS